MNVRAVELAIHRGEFAARPGTTGILLALPAEDQSSDPRGPGAEALIRWSHPTHRPVSPAQFIPAAEDCGLILRIGEWVLREVCKQAQARMDAGLVMGAITENITAMEF
jgi:EAL domain-containing protein (putative c-di-GMP-specific phosphodiesterase class I)